MIEDNRKKYDEIEEEVNLELKKAKVQGVDCGIVAEEKTDDVISGVEMKARMSSAIKH
jgi:hypothetical protein